jgi:hypothetical protein
MTGKNNVITSKAKQSRRAASCREVEILSLDISPAMGAGSIPTFAAVICGESFDAAQEHLAQDSP